MSRRRFIELRRVIRFDERSERKRNKLAPIHNVLDKFVTKCKTLYKPGPYVTVDDQLMSFRGRCPFKVYIPSKPGKYGIKIWIMSDSESHFCCNLQVYAGNIGNNREVGQAARVVLELTDHLSGSGKHVTAESFFSSIPLAKTLLSRNLTCTGTIRKNKP
jgi:hypothetical protein